MNLRVVKQGYYFQRIYFQEALIFNSYLLLLTLIYGSKENLYSSYGRSGRYGRKGVAINFVTERDLENLENLKKFYNTKIEEMPQNIVDYLSV